jgi:Ca2+-binding RTX toxin-like protein
MLPRIVLASIGLAVCVMAGAPIGALGDSAPTADLVVSQAASDCPSTTTAFDASGPLLIGDCIRVANVVTNDGPDATMVTFQLALPETGNVQTWKPIWSSYSMAAPCSLPPGVGVLPFVVCTVALPAGAQFEYDVGLIAHAPGVLSDALSVTGSAVDPDPTNDATTWQTTVGCQVNGTAGDDTLIAGPGEAACGFGGDDALIAEPGALGLFGGDGADTLVVGEATVVLAVGGAGTDTASYANAPNPVAVCPTSEGGMWSGGMASPEDGGATLWGIENIIGSSYSDRLVGNAGKNVINGGGGHDSIMGGGSTDILNGGAGNDLFTSTDGARDRIDGDAGVDRARTDHRDNVTSAKTVSTAPFNDPCLG